MEKTLPFKQQPQCEVCGQHHAVSFSLLEEGWKYTCYCTSNKERYYVDLLNFFDSPYECVDWLAHLDIKAWMNWKDFMAMIRRFRAEAFGWNQEVNNHVGF